MAVYEQKLQQDLNSMRGEIIKLGEMVSRALSDSLQALFQGEYTLAQWTVLRDFPINRQCLRLNKQCHFFIARHLPSAGHLRLVTSVMQMIIELERVGDYARTIARETIHLQTIPTGSIQRHLQEMAHHTQDILYKSMEAFAKEDVALARSTLTNSKQVTLDLNRFYEELISTESAENGRDKAIQLLDMQSIAYMLERVSNRAANICEAVLFILAGETVPVRLHEIAFLESGEGSLALLAELLARKGYGEVARFRSAALQPAATLHPAVQQFMEQRGLTLPQQQVQSLAQLLPALHDIHILVTLNNPISHYGLTIPFHTTVLQWQVGSVSDLEQANASSVEAIQQALVVQMAELMTLLVGEEGV
ncbi:phosphate signaling complex protein PhoU [Candidatus Magnetaquicoccus inordinatus]|uniref:phosphate signaling complex protein PhoU n=1 Tax=Candidatus Magnetaquicoccus inordinatus TaxID=2496818 RepID=UPI00187D4AA5|nr:phosphate signaling complex protein PhoU [Candidatus Magnetaquicoccus inordinatus]